MSDELQNSIPTEPSIPPSPQEPTADAPIPTTVSTPAEVPPGATEAPGEGFSAESNNIPPSNSAPLGGFSEAKTEEKQASSDAEALADRENEADSEPVSEPVEVPEAETAQMGRNEPLGESSRSPIRELLAKAQFAIQFRKRKKLDKIMLLFLHQSKITNDEVEKFLHVSDATATRYLSILEKEGKIKQNGKTGKGVSYSKI